MALSDLTKQLAEQAIRNAASKPATPPAPENLGSAILGQVQAMQRALKEDEELIVTLQLGGLSLRVLEFFSPTWQVAVLTGTDQDRNDKSIVRVVSPVESLQLLCRVTKVPLPARPHRIGFVSQKSKAE
jgi:hypothetical protein